MADYPTYTKYAFLDAAGVKALAAKLYTKVEASIDNRFVADATAYDTSTGKNVVSAELLRSILGVSTAAAGTDTAFARIKQLETDVGATDDEAAADGSLYARVADINAVIGDADNPADDTLRKLIANLRTDLGTTTDAKSTAADAGSAFARIAFLNDLITNNLVHLKIETVVGFVGTKEGTTTTMDDLVATPATDKLYFQKDDEDDPTWVLYIYNDSKWIVIGDTSIDLVNYWSRSEDDVAELRTALNLPEVTAMRTIDINACVDEAFVADFVIDSTAEAGETEGSTGTDAIGAYTVTEVNDTLMRVYSEAGTNRSYYYLAGAKNYVD